MAYTLTKAAKLAAKAASKEPNLIVDIEGYENQFAFSVDRKPLRFDDGYDFDRGYFFDTSVPNSKTLPLLSTKGTTTNLTQQLDQDRGTGSTPSMNITMVDYRGILTKIFSNDELLGVRANCYLSFEGLEHPRDSIRIFSGTISSLKIESGAWHFTINNPDTLKEQTLFIPYSQELTQDIDATYPAIPVETTEGLIWGTSHITTYLRIDDEIMEVISVYPDSFQIFRGALGTTATDHDEGAEVRSVYRLQGNPIELALYLMLSNRQLDGTIPDEYYYETPVASFVEGVSTVEPNTIFIESFNLGEEKGITRGDTCTIVDSNGEDGNYIIESVDMSPADFTSIKLGGTIEKDNWTPQTVAKFKTQWDKIEEGCSMLPDEVDVERHQQILDAFGNQFPDVDFLIDEEINAKEFIETELYKPIGAYFLTRKGRASIGYTAASIVDATSITLDERNLANASKIVPTRSTSRNFYNSIVHKFGYDLIRDRFTQLVTSLSNESAARIRNGLKTMTVEAKGFKKDEATKNFFSRLSQRLLDRYKFAATMISVNPIYGVGYSVEVGDIVIMDGRKLNIFDISTGKRDTFERVMEVVNKSLNIVTGAVKIDLLDTSFGANDRYATISPSSVVGVGSTTTRIKIDKSFGTGLLEAEFEKWLDCFGEPIQIRNDDFTFEEHTTLIGLDEHDHNFLLVEPIANAPSAGCYVELPEYDLQGKRSKLLHASLGNSVDVVSGIDDKTFELSTTDISKFFAGGFVDIFKDDFSVAFHGFEIEEISGNNIILKESLETTIDNTYSIHGGGFISDHGDRYAYF